MKCQVYLLFTYSFWVKYKIRTADFDRNKVISNKKDCHIIKNIHTLKNINIYLKLKLSKAFWTLFFEKIFVYIRKKLVKKIKWVLFSFLNIFLL